VGGARAVSPAAAVALALGALLFPVGRIGQLEWAVMASGVGMSLGLGLTALRALGTGAVGRARPREGVETDAPLGSQAPAG
jgi:hypothetical protein